MKRHSFYFVAVSVVILLLTGISGCQWRQNPLAQIGGNQTPAAVMFLSKQTPAISSLLVNPDRLGKQDRAIDQLKTSLLANTGLDYQQDIQPWLGNEITLALTNIDIDRNATNGRQPGYLMALATVDSNKSREFLQTLFSQRAIAGTQLKSEQYEGVKLIYEYFTPADEQNGKGLAGAVVGDRFVLFANNPKVLREAINNVQVTDLSLSNSRQYQQALTLLPPRQIGFTFLNFSTLSSFLNNQSIAQSYQSQIITLELTSQGLAAKTVLLATPTQDNPATASELSQPIEALRYIPRAGLAISGSELNRWRDTDLSKWTQVIGEVSESSSQLLKQALAAIQKSWGIDLQKDIFSWVQGEYALGLLPSASAPDWVFIAEKSDASGAGIAHLDEIAASQGLSISSLTLGEQKISAWTRLTTVPNSESKLDGTIALKAKVQGMHTTVGNYEIFTNSVEAMNAALKAPKNQSLLDNPTFKASIEPIPKPNQGYLYLDWIASQEILERQLPILRLLKVVGKPFWERLRSLTVSSYGSESGLLQGGIFFKLDSPG